MGNEASPPSPDPDAILSKSEFLTREEVLRRRHKRVSQLARVYRDHYWALMEEVKLKYREYYWKYGKSPYKEDELKETDTNNNNLNNTSTGIINGVATEERIGENGGNNHSSNTASGSADVNRCAASNCKSKAMAMTRFCHLHILSCSKQKLYKGCTFPVKSAPQGLILCARPILRSAVPSLCSSHLTKSERQVRIALKRAGLNSSSATKVAPKMHVVIAEFVRQIQRQRKAAVKETVNKNLENSATDTQVID